MTSSAAFGPIAKKVIYVDADGPLSRDDSKIPYALVNRPIWPADEVTRPGLILQDPMFAAGEKRGSCPTRADRTGHCARDTGEERMSTITRRTVVKGGLAGAAALAAPHIVRAEPQKTITFIPQSDLASLDPVWTTADVTRNYSLAVFDTLYGF